MRYISRSKTSPGIDHEWALQTGEAISLMTDQYSGRSSILQQRDLLIRNRVIEAVF
jgi:hypothetical protein